MAVEPVSLFTPLADPAELVDALRGLVANLSVDRDPVSGEWRTVTVIGGAAERDDRFPLRLNHDPSYYAEPAWSAQLAGLKVFFGRMLRHEHTDAVLDALGGMRSAFSVALSCQLDLEDSSVDDPRLGVLFALSEQLGAILFTPSALRDPRGRVLVGQVPMHPHALVPSLPTPEPELEPEPEPTAATEPEPEAGAEPELAPQPAPELAGGTAAEPERAAEPDPEPAPEPAPELARGTAPEPGSALANVVDLRAPGPPPRRVALRALALASVSSRAFLEQDDPDEVDQESERQRIERWAIDVHGLDDELEPDEWRILQAGIEMLDDRTSVDAAWRIEGLAVLAWALGLVELPAYDALADTDELNAAIGFLDADRAHEIVASAHLRPEDRIQVVYDQARAIHWRLREFRLEPSPIDFLTQAADSLLGNMEVSSCRFVGSDLAINTDGTDVAIIDADDDTVDQVQSVAYERYLAATWLLQGGTYSTTQVRS